MRSASLILAAVLAAPGMAQQAIHPHIPVIKMEVDLVTVPVTVTNYQGMLKTGLKAGNFSIYEDGEQQEILYCATEDTPVSVAVIFDNSGSMGNKTGASRTALVKFIAISNPADEYLLTTFSDTAAIERDWTTGDGIKQSMLTLGQPKGRTALFDALFLAISGLRTAKNSRKAIILITDGGENHSRYNENDIKRVLKEADIQFYAIGIFRAAPNYMYDPRAFPTPEEMMGPTLLAELAGMTGGLAFFIAPDAMGMIKEEEISDLAVHIGRALRDQYVLAYKPQARKAHDGKRHKLKVKLHLSKGMEPLIPYARYGYTSSPL